MAVNRVKLSLVSWKRGIKGLVNNIVFPENHIAMGPFFLTEEDIPGSSLNRKDPSALKNSDLKFWLRCWGDSYKGLSTKAQLCKRYVCS